MSRKSNEERKDDKTFLLEKSNQISTIEQESTTWLESSENEVPVGVNRQDFLKIFEYRQVSGHGCDDIAIIEESCVQEIETCTSADQTDYVIDVHKYSNEKVKPYFLNYLTIPETQSEQSLNSIQDYLDTITKEFKESSVTNSVTNTDAEISTVPPAPPQSPFPDKFLTLTQGYREIVNTTFHVENSSEENTPYHLVNNKNIPKCLDFLPENSNRSRNTRTELFESLISDPVKELVFTNNTMSTPPDIPDVDEIPQVQLLACKKRPPPPPPPEPPTDDIFIMCMKDNIRFKLRCKKIGGSDGNERLGDESRYECEVVPDPNVKIDKAILEACDLRCKLCEHNNDNIPIEPFDVHYQRPDSEPESSTVTKNNNMHIKPFDVHYQQSDSDPESSTITKTMKKDSVMKIIIKTDCDKSNSNVSVESDCSQKYGSESPSRESRSGESIKVCPPKCKGPCIDVTKIRNPDNKKKNDEAKSRCQSTTIIIYQEPEEKEVKKEQECVPRPPPCAAPPPRPPPPPDCSPPPPPPEISKSKSSIFGFLKCKPSNKKIEKLEHKEEKNEPTVSRSASTGKDGCPPSVFEEITSAMVQAHHKTVATIKCAAEDILCNPKKCDDPGPVDKIIYTAQNVMCDLHKQVKEGEFQRSAENLYKSCSKTMEVARNKSKQYDENPCQRPKPKDCSYHCSQLEYESDSSSEIMDVLKEKSVVSLYGTICKAAHEVAEIACNSITIFGLECDRPPIRTQSSEIRRRTVNNPADKSKYSATKLIYDKESDKRTPRDVSAEERMDKIRCTAEHICDTVRQTAINIKETTSEAASDFAERSKKLITNENNILQNKKDNIKSMLSGFSMFKDAFPGSSDEGGVKTNDIYQVPGTYQAPDTYKAPGAIASGINSIRESLRSLSKIEIPEKSSRYDTPSRENTKPRNVELEAEPLVSVSGVFATIKDKIFSMFNEWDLIKRPEAANNANNSSEEDDE